jgi:hypothetical protein
MKTVHSWDDLCHYGVVPLTGEACGLSYRILCDVTAQGKRILEKALGVAELRLHENWNCGSPSDPHIGSILLAPEVMTFLAVFALLENGCHEVWQTKHSGVVGIEASDPADRLETFQRFQADNLVRRFAYAGTAGDRNLHVMSGRIQ